jgi:hypothetical protein
MIDRQPTFGHHFLEIAVAERIDVGFILRHFPRDYCTAAPMAARTGTC